MPEIVGETSIQAEVPAQSVEVTPVIRTRAPQMQQDPIRDPSLPATTTFQQDLTTAGQRRINLVWEYTQAIIAIMVILANMIVGVYQGLFASAGTREYPIILSSSLFLVVGFYFSRTNHAAVGGIGPKSQGTYTGRSVMAYLRLGGVAICFATAAYFVARMVLRA